MDASSLLAMIADRLEQCEWPPLAPPYGDALREAVEFVMNTVDAVGIVATGTIVRGSPHASSDLDVCVIHGAPFRQRIQRLFHGVPTEIFINPPAMIRRYFVQEHRDARPITAHMFATGVVVFETDVVVDALRREAAEWLAKRSSISEDHLIRARYEAATLLEDGVDVGADDPETGTMLLTRAVIAMLELDCWVNDGRIPRSKGLLGTIAHRNTDLGRWADTFFSATSYADRETAAESIADLTIGARGFFAWDSGPDPVTQSASSPRSNDDRKAIDGLRDAWIDAVAARDASALGSLVTADYEVWTHGAPTLTGPDAVVATIGAALSKYAITQSYDPIETVVTGDWAFQRGIERIRAVPREGGSVQEVTQRGLLVLRRGEDGRWRYARGMTNGLPPAMPNAENVPS
jgi:uncharacterized protein (TIGR02246 family)